MIRRSALALVALVTLVAAPTAQAQTAPADLGQLSIEELMDLSVTSAARKDQRAWDVAAALHVITQEDIRRSGMTTIPDLLRLVPGVQVAQINANKWAVTVRGFNGLYANKLLVLVDGRSVYTRLFSGVLWDDQDLVLDDVDRIEVIRGPGAALWGANAVNGVINIVSKAASATQGGLVRADGGSGQQGLMRYGGRLGATPYRVYAQWTNRTQSVLASGADANDTSSSVTTGFRADWGARPSAVLLEGAITAGRTRGLFINLDLVTAAREPTSQDSSEALSGHVLGRWTHTGANGGALQVQSFVDFVNRDEPVGDYDRHAFDLDSHYRVTFGRRHDVVVGAGYRYLGESLIGHAGFALTPDDENSTLLTAFAQDEIALGARVSLTLGSQVQHHSATGGAVQPTARVMWRARPRQRLWAAVSRALRTPSLSDQGIRIDYPPVPGPGGLPLYVTGQGNPDARSEVLIDAEVGYRLEVGAVASIDVTGFAGRYRHLTTDEPADPVVQFAPTPRILVTSTFGNALAATTRGLEVAGHWALAPGWQVDASLTAFRLSPSLAATSRDPDAAQETGSAPRLQWQVRSVYTPMTRGTVSLALFHVGPIPQLQVAAYTRADATAEWRLTSRVSLMAIGQNLLRASHPEFDGLSALVLGTEMPRTATLRLRWTSR